MHIRCMTLAARMCAYMCVCCHKHTHTQSDVFLCVCVQQIQVFVCRCMWFFFAPTYFCFVSRFKFSVAILSCWRVVHQNISLGTLGEEQQHQHHHHHHHYQYQYAKFNTFAIQALLCIWLCSAVPWQVVIRKEVVFLILVG